MSIEYFGLNSTYSPFSDSMSLRTVTNEKFSIPNTQTFLNKPVISVATGLIPTTSSFLDESFKVVVEEPNGNELIVLKKVLGKVGNDTYPTEYEVMWFNEENMQSVFWIHKKWHDKVLSITGDFIATTITGEFISRNIQNLVGCVIAFSGDLSNMPDNSLYCDGREISRITYKRLFNKIGTTWGEGDGIETFNIPDGRAGVLKGAGTSSKYGTYTQANGAVVDLNEDRGAVGSYQSTAIKNITGEVYGIMIKDWNGTGYGVFSTHRYGSAGPTYDAGNDYIHIYMQSSRVVPTGQTNRDNNLAVHWIVYY